MWAAFDGSYTATLTRTAITVPMQLLHMMGYSVSRWDAKASYRLWCVFTHMEDNTLVLNLFERRVRQAVAVKSSSKSHRFARIGCALVPVRRALQARPKKKGRQKIKLRVVGYHQNCLALRTQ